MSACITEIKPIKWYRLSSIHKIGPLNVLLLYGIFSVNPHITVYLQHLLDINLRNCLKIRTQFTALSNGVSSSISNLVAAKAVVQTWHGLRTLTLTEHTNTDLCENWGNTSQTRHAAELDYDYIFHVQSHNSRSKKQLWKFVTGYEKRDHWGFFKKIEFWYGLIALCVLNPMVRVSNKNIDHNCVELWPFLCTRVDTFVFRKTHIFN